MPVMACHVWYQGVAPFLPATVFVPGRPGAAPNGAPKGAPAPSGFDLPAGFAAPSGFGLPSWFAAGFAPGFADLPNPAGAVPGAPAAGAGPAPPAATTV